MKRIIKSIALFAVILSTAVCTLALGGCGASKLYEGEYGYVSWGTSYGIKVLVEVDDSRIKSVRALKSDYVDGTPAEYGWTDIELWNQSLEEYLNSFYGARVEDIMNINVVVKDTGEPVSKDDGSFSQYGEENKYLISSCTVGCGRVILAIQNALSKINA